MKVNKITSVNPFFAQGLSTSNKENDKNLYQTNLLKKQETSVSFGAVKFPVKQIKELIAQLDRDRIYYELFQSPKSVTVIEIKDTIKIDKTTTFLSGSRKKVMKYKPDGRIPDIGYLYEKDKLKKITRFSADGKKTYTETYTNKGQREGLIVYSKTVDLPIKKIIFQEDGKTPKQEIFFYEGTRDIRAIKEYRKNGELKSIKTFVKKEV